MKRAAVGTIALLVGLTGCFGSAGTTQGFCRRFVNLAEDDVTAEEFVEKVQEDEIGRPKGTIGQAHRRLLRYLEDGDPRADGEISHIFDACVSSYE